MADEDAKPPAAALAALVPEVLPLERPTGIAAQRMALIKRVDDRLRRKATNIVAAIPDAARLDDGGTPIDGTPVDDAGRPKGWTGVRHQVAKDARRPLKTRPGYLSDMVRVYESFAKQDALRQVPGELGADIKVYVHNATFNYPVRDVTPPSEREPPKPKK